MTYSNDRNRHKLHEIIFEADTRAGRNFDIALLLAILLSVIVVMLETTKSVAQRFGDLLHTIEWVLTIFFTIEYILRLYVVRKPWKYATSFYGVVDLLAILPTYLSIFIVGAQSLLVIRVLRLLRVFRIFKLFSYMQQGRMIVTALRASYPKIMVFILFVLLLVTICGSVMYLVEAGANSEFDSIPRSIYWAIVTLTTVGYGDVYPVTGMGKLLSGIIALIGVGIVALPTGIISSAFIEKINQDNKTCTCPNCGADFIPKK